VTGKGTLIGDRAKHAEYDRWMDFSKPAEASAAPTLRERDQIDDRFKWDLTKIYPDWDVWQRAYGELNRKIDEFAALRGSLAKGASALLAAFVLRDEIGQLEYKVWYFASLCYDQDQRDNQANAKRQEVQILFARAAQASAWFDP
jgi:oligoendopeptidase F